MKTKINLTFLVSMLSLYGLFAQNDPEFTGSLLWKISGNGSKPTYIFGTHHLIQKSFLDKNPLVLKALGESEQLICEIAPDDMQNTQSSEAFILMSMPRDTTYKMLFTENELLTLETELTYATGKGLKDFENIKPAAISAIYLMAANEKINPSEDPTNAIPLDLYLMQVAINDNKPVLGLETVYEQMNILFNSQSLKRQAETLYCTVTHSEHLPEYMELLEKYYTEANLEKLDILFNEKNELVCDYTPDEKKALNKDRNDKWIKKLPEIMQQKSSFIATGCLHLVGKDGLLHQLQTLGYTIEPVN